jgi:hypothetical protein
MNKSSQTHCCQAMATHISSSEVPIKYVPHFREYGISVRDGGSSFQVLAYCPWCGRKLPRSLRDEWFARLDELGLDPEDQSIPRDMKSDRWWRKSKVKSQELAAGGAKS